MSLRTIALSKQSGGYTITVTLPENATRWDVSAAAIKLNRLSPFLEDACPGCGVATGASGRRLGDRDGDRVHALGCPLAPVGFLDLLRADAGIE